MRKKNYYVNIGPDPTRPAARYDPWTIYSDRILSTMCTTVECQSFSTSPNTYQRAKFYRNFNGDIWVLIRYKSCSWIRIMNYSVSQKIPPTVFDIFSQTDGNF